MAAAFIARVADKVACRLMKRAKLRESLRDLFRIGIRTTVWFAALITAAGILILWRFPFENGDYIEVDGLMGRVEDVEIRSTSIRKTDSELVIVPNSTIFKNKVTVMTNRLHRRLELAVGIAYGEDVATGRKVILGTVNSCESVAKSPKPEVLATAFGASSIDFDVLWVDRQQADRRAA